MSAPLDALNASATKLRAALTAHDSAVVAFESLRGVGTPEEVNSAGITLERAASDVLAAMQEHPRAVDSLMRSYGRGVPIP